MAKQSRWLGKLHAALQGEQSAETLESYRRAGRIAYQLIEDAERDREALAVSGTSPWTADPATQARFLCAWNAFALQALGDAFLDADYRLQPMTAGYVPAVTSEQLLAFYGQVQEWTSRARQAAASPTYVLDVEVPAALPPWVQAEPCPLSHLEGMLAATREFHAHVQTASSAVLGQARPEDQPSVEKLRALLASAESSAEYAEALVGRQMPQRLHEELERYAKASIEQHYALGQLLAMPSLAAGYDPKSAGRPVPRPGGTRLPAPGEPGFDEWCLTDAASRSRWKRDPQAQEAIEALWRNDPDPRATLDIQRQIEAALDRGDIAYATGRNGARLGNYYCCPWSPIYSVRRPVRIGEVSLRPMQQFTFDASAEEALEGGDFRREILVGVFNPTAAVDYCNPLAGGHSD